MIEDVLGTAGTILAPFAELLMNETIIGLIVLIAGIMKLGTWLDQKTVLDKYKGQLELKKKMIDMEKDIMSGKERLDYDKIGNWLTTKFSDPTDALLKQLDKELEKWK